MKGLILNGSPRRNGKIGQLMKYAARSFGRGGGAGECV